MPGPAKCGYPGCDVAWTFYDFLKCGDVRLGLDRTLLTGVGGGGRALPCRFSRDSDRRDERLCRVPVLSHEGLYLWCM